LPQLIPLAVNSLIALALPGSVALGAGGAVLTGTALTISSLVTAGIFIGGSIALNALLAPDRPNQPKSEGAREVYEVGDAPRVIVLGRARVGGNIVFKAAKDNVFYAVVAHCQGPISAIEEVYLGGRSATVDPDGSVSSPPYGQVNAADWVSVLSKHGYDNETAFAELVAAFPDNWTADHRGLGYCHSLLKATSPGISDEDQRHFKIYANGAPTVELLVSGPAWFDPRTNDFRWSDNGVLGVLWLLTASERDGGWGLPLDRFDLADIAAQADMADQFVPLKAGGIERRCRIAGAYTTETGRGDVLANALLSTGTQILPTTDGLWTIRLVDDNPTPTAEILLPDNVSMAWTAGPEQVERPNRLRLTYYSPERRYDVGDVPLDNIPWAEFPDEIEAVGERSLDLALTFCPSHRQAAQIARRMFALQRAPRGEITTNLAGLIAMGHAHALIPIPDIEETVLAGLSAPRLNQDGTINISFVEHPMLEGWNPAAHEPDPPDFLPEVVDGDAPAAPVMVEGTFSGTQLRARFTKEISGGTVEAVYRQVPTAGPPNAWAAMTIENTGTSVWVYKNAVDTSKSYEVRARVAASATEAPSEWSNIIIVP
jgi:hypothetical protein